jgi:glycosyltransferase involved in cell wall biosynthesis
MRTFHPLYRPDLAVAAFAELHRRRPSATLTLAGQDKGELQATRRLVDAAGLGAAVTFAGFLDRSAKAEAFAAHDLFLNTTRTDNAPVSLLEAAAHGLVVVSTPAGGIADLFTDGLDVLLAEDADALADAMEAVLDDPTLAERLSAAGRRLAESASWAQVGPRWHELLDDLIRP